MSAGSEILRKWAASNLLPQVSVSADGMQLSCNGETINDANSEEAKVHVEADGKSCDYTLASIYLQIVKPEQRLLDYRKVCKQYQVKDGVKPIDKPIVLAYFLQAAAAAPSSQAPASAATTRPAAPAPDKHKREKRHKHKKDKHRHKDGKRRHSSSSAGRGEQSSAQKKKPKTIDNAKLMANLGTVVGKRSAAATSAAVADVGSVSEAEIKARRELHAVLSCAGFGVSAELLQEHRNKTAEILSWEIPVGNSASILQAAPGKDLSNILEMYLETINPSKKKGSSGASSRSQHRGTQLGSSSRSGSRPHLVGQKPIIVLPKGMTAPLTLINAHEFFGKRQFVPRDLMQKQQAGRAKAAIVTTFSRKVNARLGGGTVEYELIDNPKQRLKSAKDWDRVVAIVALGASWQFKDWPGIYSNPVHLFSKTFGFYVGMEGAKIPKDILQWAVTRTTLSRDKRGLDSVTYASFWNGLDEFMAIHKPEMLPQDTPM